MQLRPAERAYLQPPATTHSRQLTPISADKASPTADSLYLLHMSRTGAAVWPFHVPTPSPPRQCRPGAVRQPRNAVAGGQRSEVGQPGHAGGQIGDRPEKAAQLTRTSRAAAALSARRPDRVTLFPLSPGSSQVLPLLSPLQCCPASHYAEKGGDSMETRSRRSEEGQRSKERDPWTGSRKMSVMVRP